VSESTPDCWSTGYITVALSHGGEHSTVSMPSLRQLALFASSLILAQAKQPDFEPADFNVTAALESYGVDVSATTPDGLQKRSSDHFWPCSTAVRE
jgi:hypothetical protein